MTSIPSLTQEQQDRREFPGGGRLHPVRHIVRIVVVQFSSDDHSLEAAAQILQQPPEGAPDARPIFDLLEPTDIVVVGQKPASVITTEGADNRRSRQLVAHDHHNRDTVLRVWTESDTIEYQCDQPFEIVNVERAGWKIYGAPDNPFGIGKADYKAQERELATSKTLYVWTSGLLPASANNQQYKTTFRIGGELIDPDVVCGTPPPS